MATTWKKILTKTPVALDLGASAADGYVLTATGDGSAIAQWEAVGAGSNTTYSIKAETVSGGADLDLDAGGSGSGTDTIKFASGGSTTVSRSDASTITISSSQCGGDGHAKYTNSEAVAAINATSSINTTCDSPDVNHNTHRGIDDTPVNGEVSESITSNWAYDHAASSTAHHTKYTNSEAVAAVNATSSITTTCDSPNILPAAGTGIDVTMSTVSADLKSNGGIVLAGVANELAVDLAASAIVNALGETDGGTGQTSYSTGEMLYSDAANSLAKIAAGTEGYYLQMGMGSVPGWVSSPNTHRGIDDTPVNGQTAESITSNWAYDHAASSTAHHTKYTNAEAVAAVNATSSITTTCDSPDVNHNTDINTNLSNLIARLPQITENITFGDATDVTITTSGDLTVTGDLTVSGDTISTSAEILEIADNTILLNAGHSAAEPAQAGIVVERGSTADNATLHWTKVSSGADTVARWIVGSNDNADLATSPTYVADVMQVRIDNATINESSSEVPVGHMQYHAGELYLRVENA